MRDIAEQGIAFLRRLGRRDPARSTTRAMRVAAPPTVASDVYEIRDRIARRTIQPDSHGLEIGAGSHPQRLPEGARCSYVDKRDADALQDLFECRIDYVVHTLADVPTLFPNGADFLIAHNVLEHSHDPIGTLITWNSWLHNGGIAIISIPDKEHCSPDSRRLPPDAFHLLSDHLFARGEDAFESREHIPGFLAGWQEHIHPDKTRSEYCAHCLEEAQRGDHDLHWHALDRAACDTIMAAAQVLGRRHIEILDIHSPSEGDVRTLGETIYVYRVLDAPAVDAVGARSDATAAAERELRDVLRVYRQAARRIEDALGELPQSPHPTTLTATSPYAASSASVPGAKK